jgi:hypothetical protein
MTPSVSNRELATMTTWLRKAAEIGNFYNFYCDGTVDSLMTHDLWDRLKVYGLWGV